MALPDPRAGTVDAQATAELCLGFPLRGVGTPNAPVVQGSAVHMYALCILNIMYIYISGK